MTDDVARPPNRSLSSSPGAQRALFDRDKQFSILAADALKDLFVQILSPYRAKSMYKTTPLERITFEDQRPMNEIRSST
jgi:hypothetical protein